MSLAPDSTLAQPEACGPLSSKLAEGKISCYLILFVYLFLYNLYLYYKDICESKYKNKYITVFMIKGYMYWKDFYLNKSVLGMTG